LLLGALHVLLDHAYTFDHNLMFGTVDLEDLTLGATVIAGDDLYEITCMDMGFN
jgi:hypothetical protein